MAVLTYLRRQRKSSSLYLTDYQFYARYQNTGAAVSGAVTSNVSWLTSATECAIAMKLSPYLAALLLLSVIRRSLWCYGM